MIKNLVICVVLIGLFLVQVPTTSAWFPNTHKQIVECNYNSFPPDIQRNMDIKKMKEGSTAPDVKFRDFSKHQYPESYPKIQKWLNKGHEAYYQGNYRYASYCYGVASHYITDTFAAPHAARVRIFSDYKHGLYEFYAYYWLKPHLQNILYFGDLDSALYTGQINGQINWKCWTRTFNSYIIQNNLDQATTASYNIIFHSLNT